MAKLQQETAAASYAVFGHPIGHSQSPRIHALFAAQTGQDMAYAACDVPAASFSSRLDKFISDGGRGLNCTVPLKELAFARADSRSERAERAKAVNTLKVLEDGSLYGDNTDGAGLLRDLIGNLKLDLQGRRILLLGAGGASRGVIQPLLDANPKSLFIANRTADKAQRLAHEFQGLGNIESGGFEALGEAHSFDLILNATAASLSGELPPLPGGILAAGGVCYDLAYGAQPTPFVLWGESVGAGLSVDGLGMLVEQAAEAFCLWRGVYPQTKPVIEALRLVLKESHCQKI
jgi:shikimate dehydrogenase